MSNYERIPEEESRIPVVSSETLESATASLSENPLEYYMSAGRKLMTEQPRLNEYLGAFVHDYARSPAEERKMLEVVLFMYDTLGRQSEADRMTEAFDV